MCIIYYCIRSKLIGVTNAHIHVKQWEAYYSALAHETRVITCAAALAAKTKRKGIHNIIPTPSEQASERDIQRERERESDIIAKIVEIPISNYARTVKIDYPPFEKFTTTHSCFE